MPCSLAVSDGTCEAACACRITRVRHSSANSEVVSGTASQRRVKHVDVDNGRGIEVPKAMVFGLVSGGERPEVGRVGDYVD